MKKFLAITLVLMFVLCFLPGLVPNLTAYANAEEYAPQTPSGTDEDTGDANFLDARWKLVWDYDSEGNKIATATNYVAPVSDDGIYEYEPGSWLLDQMLNKLDSVDADHLCIELSAGSFKPITAPSVAPYSGGEAGEPVYSALFKLPGQDEGRTFPDKNIELAIFFPGNITVRVPGQELSSVLSAVGLNVYGDRLVVDLVGAGDAEAYIEVPCTGTPVWIDAEGNEVEAEYEYDEANGVYKIAVKSGLTLVFKA